MLLKQSASAVEQQPSPFGRNPTLSGPVLFSRQLLLIITLILAALQGDFDLSLKNEHTHFFYDRRIPLHCGLFFSLLESVFCCLNAHLLWRKKYIGSYICVALCWIQN